MEVENLLENDVGCPTTTTKMVWHLERQVHRLLITTIWGGGRRCAIRLQQPQGCCALAIVTPAPIVAALAVPRTALNLQAIENKQEQDNKQTRNPDEKGSASVNGRSRSSTDAPCNGQAKEVEATGSNVSVWLSKSD